MYLYICVHTWDPETSVSGPWPFCFKFPWTVFISWPLDPAVCFIVVRWLPTAQLFYILQDLSLPGIGLLLWLGLLQPWCSSWYSGSFSELGWTVPTYGCRIATWGNQIHSRISNCWWWPWHKPSFAALRIGRSRLWSWTSHLSHIVAGWQVTWPACVRTVARMGTMGWTAFRCSWGSFVCGILSSVRWIGLVLRHASRSHSDGLIGHTSGWSFSDGGCRQTDSIDPPDGAGFPTFSASPCSWTTACQCWGNHPTSSSTSGHLDQWMFFELDHSGSMNFGYVCISLVTRRSILFNRYLRQTSLKIVWFCISKSCSRHHCHMFRVTCLLFSWQLGCARSGCFWVW